MANMTYALFLGCMIPFRELSYEISARRVAAELELELRDMPDANCCGLPIDPVNHELMLLLAARNLCIAEKMEMDIVSLCNGCTGVLMKVNKMLKQDRELQQHINSQLGNIGLEFKGAINVKHFVQVLKEIGFNKLKDSISHPLTPLTIAGYTGCHLFRPSEYMEIDNPENPSILDDLIELTGATSVSYIDEFQCCGASEGAIDNRIPQYLAREKFKNAKNAGADAMVTLCPACHQILDGNQRQVERRFKETYDLPIFHYPQLLGLAMGIPADELAVSDLRVKPDKVLAVLTSGN